MTEDEMKKIEELKERINFLEKRIEIAKISSKRDWSAFRLSGFTAIELIWFFNYCEKPTKFLLYALILGGLTLAFNGKDFYDNQKNLNNQIKETYKVKKKL